MGSPPVPDVDTRGAPFSMVAVPTSCVREQGTGSPSALVKSSKTA
jgi:hypothetical protein